MSAHLNIVVPVCHGAKTTGHQNFAVKITSTKTLALNHMPKKISDINKNDSIIKRRVSYNTLRSSQLLGISNFLMSS